MVPILLTLGIGTYFSGLIQGKMLAMSVTALVSLIIAITIRNKFPFIKYIFLILFFIVIGYFLAGYRVYSLATQTLDKELRPTNISGVVERVHLYEDDKIRLTLRETIIRDISPLTLVNVRVNKFDEMPYSGDKVEIRTGLMPPPGPSMPGDYDYGRQVWFQGLSTVGYAVSLHSQGLGIYLSVVHLFQRFVLLLWL